MRRFIDRVIGSLLLLALLFAVANSIEPKPTATNVSQRCGK